MDSCHNFSTCMEMKEANHDVSARWPTKVIHCRLPTLYSIFSWRKFTEASDTHRYAFIEAALSPFKYALFLYLGSMFAIAVEIVPLATSSIISTKIGAVGGTSLTLLYFALLMKKQNYASEADSSPVTLLGFIAALLKEMFYSSLAAVVGGVAYGCTEHLRTLAVIGVLGPWVFLVVMFALLLIGVGVAWGIERWKVWRSGY